MGEERKKMLDKLWDDVVAGPHPETGLEKLRKAATARPILIDKGTILSSYSSSSTSNVVWDRCRPIYIIIEK